MVKRRSRDPQAADAGLSGILRGLGGLVEKLTELAEAGGELSRSSELRGSGAGKELRGVYGFTVKVGLGGEGVKIEPFGNVRRDEASGRSVVQEIREPVVDVFEEADHTLIVAEMPGVGIEDVHLEVVEDLLTITAERGDQKYRKEILLPQSFPREKMRVSCVNGIVEIRCVR